MAQQHSYHIIVLNFVMYDVNIVSLPEMLTVYIAIYIFWTAAPMQPLSR